ncbi:NADPH-dependent FMN reductase [Undibacterium sp. TJN25]|uniref:NADPH-dependent FMN reductase n=1 Tax=Undibacterium sp. TJN25 TaxID=3413056 RepID=UPI003BEFDCB4
MGYRIAVIVGSLRKESYNKKLAHALVSLAPEEHSFGFVDIQLPLLNQDLEHSLPAEVAAFKKSIQDAQGLLFVTPEYNRSIPGVLKNAIDWGSRPNGTSAWAGKPAAIAGISPGSTGTAMAQQHLRNVLSALDVPVMPSPELFLQAKEGFFDADGGIASESSKQFLQKYLARYIDWIHKFAK